MNEGKECASFVCPETFNQLLCYMRIYFHFPYRQTEGVVRAHAYDKVPPIRDCSTINRRINKLYIKINERIGNDIVIVLDSTGIKVTSRGGVMYCNLYVYCDRKMQYCQRITNP
jgi:hypothetical protein